MPDPIHRAYRTRTIQYLITLLCFSLLSSCDNTPYPPHTIGYVEGEYRYLAAPSAGWLREVAVTKGDTIHAGQTAFMLYDDINQFALQQAQAQLQAQRAQTQNLQTGARHSEIASLEAQLNAAKAQLELANRTLARYQKLQAAQAIARIQVDEAQAQARAAKATVDGLQAELQTARSPAREPLIEAAQATTQANEAAVAQAHYRQAQRTIRSHFNGMIDQVFFHTGEFVGTGQVVLQILLQDQRKVIFYVSASQLSHLHHGQTLTIQRIHEPSATATTTATISHINASVSYTPPIIYSNENSDKLTYRVEATIAASEQPYHIAEPIRVYLP